MPSKKQDDNFLKSLNYDIPNKNGILISNKDHHLNKAIFPYRYSSKMESIATPTYMYEQMGSLSFLDNPKIDQKLNLEQSIMRFKTMPDLDSNCIKISEDLQPKKTHKNDKIPTTSNSQQLLQELSPSTPNLNTYMTNNRNFQMNNDPSLSPDILKNLPTIVTSRITSGRLNSGRIHSGKLNNWHRDGNGDLEKLLDEGGDEEDEFDFENHPPLLPNFELDFVNNLVTPDKREGIKSLENLNFQIQNQPIIMQSKRPEEKKKIPNINIIPREFKEPIQHESDVNCGFKDQYRELHKFDEEIEKHSSLYDMTRSSQDSFVNDFPLQLQNLKNYEPNQKSRRTLSFSSIPDFPVSYNAYHN